MKESTILKPKEIPDMKRIIQIILLAIAPFYALAQWTTSGSTITGSAYYGPLTLDLKTATYGSATLSLSPNSGGIGIINVNNYSGAANPLAFQTNASERMRIGANGNVGIGTTNPAYKLDVAGTINATSILVNGAPISGGGASQWTTSGTTITGQAGSPGSLTVDLRTATAGNTILSLSPNTGGIGILKVNNYGSTANPLTFQTNSLERMRINGNGNVGIGTTAPLLENWKFLTPITLLPH